VVRGPVTRDGDGLELALLADTAEGWNGVVRVERVGFDGAVLAGTEIEVALGPRESTAVPLPDAVAVPGDPRRELIVVRSSGAPATHFWFAADVDADLPAPLWDVTADRTPDGYDVTVTARTLVKDLALLADRLDPDAVVDEMLLTLLPGASAVLHVRTGRELTVAAFGGAPVLRCANDLVAGRPDR
jgi:beta-mannosidase